MKVSVVIPVFNAEKTVGKCLNSVLNQDYKNYDVIVIDDNSEDDTKKIIQRFENKNLFLLENNKNLGPAATRNIGIKSSRGEIIFFTDSDCEVPKNWISRLLKEYKSEKIAGVGGYLKPEAKNWVAKLEHLQNKFLLGIKNKKIAGGEKTPMGYTNNVSYRKNILNEVNGFDERFPFPAGEDIDLKKRICSKGYNVVYIPVSVIHLEEYNLDYLLKRIITRSLDIKPPRNIFVKCMLVVTSLPLIIFNIVKKLIKYKKQGVL